MLTPRRCQSCICKTTRGNKCPRYVEEGCQKINVVIRTERFWISDVRRSAGKWRFCPSVLCARQTKRSTGIFRRRQFLGCWWFYLIVFLFMNLAVASSFKTATPLVPSPLLSFTLNLATVTRSLTTLLMEKVGWKVIDSWQQEIMTNVMYSFWQLY